MRWERLFEDLEAQLTADDARDLEVEVADRTRRERALLGIHERFLSVLEAGTVSVRVAGVGTLQGSVIGVGPDWVLLGDGHPHGGDHSVLVAYHAIRSLTGLTGRLQERRPGAVAKGFALGAALRALSRDRAVVALHDVEGIVVTGTVDAVGQDLVDIAEHPTDLPRRPENVIGIRTVPFWSIAAIRHR